MLQNGGGPTDAYSMGINDASGDILLFLDDDAIAHTEWILWFVKLFEEYKDVGGITGFTKKAAANSSNIVLKDDQFYDEKCAESPHIKPLKILENYEEYFAAGGLSGISCECLRQDKGIIKSTLFGGLNIGFRLNLIKEYRLKIMYKGSRIGFWWENFIALNVVLRGYDAIRVRHPSIAPIVYHTVNVSSLTRGKGLQARILG